MNKEEKSPIQKLSSLFEFDKKQVERYMMNKLGLKEKFVAGFNYVYKNLGINLIPEDISTLEWYEGKNYNWVTMVDNLDKPSIKIIIRHYHNHFTIFFKNIKDDKYDIRDNEDEFNDLYSNRFGCIEFYTNTSNLSGDESDSYVNDNFKDINKYLPNMVKMIKDGDAHSVWNSLCLKLDTEKDRPKHIEVRCIWDGGDDISSIDKFIFACDELFQRYLEIFSETEMFEKIKTLKVGDMCGRYEVVSINTDLEDEDEDDYYHDVGLELKGTNGADSVSWQDVYDLSRWYLESVFSNNSNNE